MERNGSGLQRKTMMSTGVIKETLKGIDSINLLIIFPIHAAQFLSVARSGVVKVSDTILGLTLSYSVCIRDVVASCGRFCERLSRRSLEQTADGICGHSASLSSLPGRLQGPSVTELEIDGSVFSLLPCLFLPLM